MRLIIYTILLLVSSVAYSQEIKIMSWNIFMVPPLIFKSCQTERAILIAEYIKNVNPDIIVMEEAFMKSTRNSIKEKLDSFFPYSSQITKGGFFKTNSGIWIVSKYPLYNQQLITYKKKKGSDIFAKKGAVFVETIIHHKKMQLIATHTQSLKKYANTRTQQFIQLKKQLLDNYFSDTIPQFIIGDINCDYFDTVDYHNMLQTLDVLPVTFSGEQYSWNGLENDLANKFSEHTLETLDYILLRNAHKEIASIQSTEIINSKYKQCFCKSNFNYLSDHHPIISVIKLK